MELDAEGDIDWGALTDDAWKFWTPHKLQQRWASLKKTVHTPGATHHGEHICPFHVSAYP